MGGRIGVKCNCLDGQLAENKSIKLTNYCLLIKGKYLTPYLRHKTDLKYKKML